MASNEELVERLVRLVETSGHRVTAQAVVRTGKSELAAQLKQWIANPTIQLVIGIEGATMRAALLPLITKRLPGFTELRDVDGGQCDSTIVILLPKEFSIEITEPIFARIELASRGRRQPTQPPPPPRPSSTSSSSLIVARNRPKTAPPPVPMREEPDFVRTHTKSPEAEFAAQVAAISPIRLEPVPLVVAPIPQPPPPPPRRHGGWIALAAAVICGSLVGGAMRLMNSSAEDRPQPPAAAPSSAPAEADRVELDVEATEVIDEVDTSIEMPEVKMRRQKAAEVPLWKVFQDKPSPIAAKTKPCDAMSCMLHDFAQPCCAKFRMMDCATPSLDFAQAAACRLTPRR